MHRATRALILAISVSALMATTAYANRGGVAAVPLNNGQETTDAKLGGSGTFEWWVDGVDLCYVLTVRRLTDTPVAAHIHGPADRTEAAGIVIPLDPPDAATGTTEACFAPDPAALAAVVADPTSYYVNVHTAAYPGGEVRGQLK